VAPVPSPSNVQVSADVQPNRFWPADASVSKKHSPTAQLDGVAVPVLHAVVAEHALALSVSSDAQRNREMLLALESQTRATPAQAGVESSTTRAIALKNKVVSPDDAEDVQHAGSDRRVAAQFKHAICGPRGDALTQRLRDIEEHPLGIVRLKSCHRRNRV